MLGLSARAMAGLGLSQPFMLRAPTGHRPLHTVRPKRFPSTRRMGFHRRAGLLWQA